MAKQAKSKAPGKSAGGKRAAPYAKPGPSKKAKPSVEVRYEGAAATPKAAVKPAPKAAAAPQPKPKPKGKEKAAAVIEAPAAAPAAPVTPAPVPSPTFKIIAGSYEKLLYGLEGTYVDGAPVLTPIFIFPAHLSWVKAAAASPGGKWLATGSEDEFVKVWDLRRRKEVGSLSQHQGSITSITFPTRSHLVTASADATISLFRTSDWALLKSLKGHSGRINCIDVHPTGRVALSVGKDKTLKMWDLMRGRGAASLALGDEAELVKFSPKGTHFAVLYPRKVELYSLVRRPAHAAADPQTLKLVHTLETKSRFNHLAFVELPSAAGDDDSDDGGVELLAIGTEKGVIEVYTVELGSSDDEDEEDEDEDDDDDAEAAAKGPSADVDRIATLTGHTNRIKSLSALPFAAAPGGPTVLLTSVSSDGLINLYDMGQVATATAGEADDIKPVASYDTKGSRLVCVTMADGPVPRVPKAAAAATAAATGGKRAAFADEDDEEESDEEDEDDDEDAELYDSGAEEEENSLEVEFEDEEEEEEEEEGEYED
ncbi:Protein mak11 [Vanrija albida]|uniref:Protein mak11 n=1 Tax=Vanrija albida TaxID=181172 RepID=A0ABR3PYW7_9TREE